MKVKKQTLVDAIKTHRVFECDLVEFNTYYFIKTEDIKTNLFYKLNISEKLIDKDDIQDLACDYILENEYCDELHKKFADDIVKEFPELMCLFEKKDLYPIHTIITLDKDYIKENIADKVDKFVKNWRSKNEVHYETEYFTYDEEDYPISDLLYREISDDEKNSIISDIANLDTIKEECDYKINKLQKELDTINTDIQRYEKYIEDAKEAKMQDDIDVYTSLLEKKHDERRVVLSELENTEYEKENANDDEIDINIDFEFYNDDLYDIDYNDYNFSITL